MLLLEKTRINNDIDRQEDIDCSSQGLNIGPGNSGKLQIIFNVTDADSTEWQW